MYPTRPIASTVNSEPSVCDIKMPSVAIFPIMLTHTGRISHRQWWGKSRPPIYPQRIGIVEPVFANIRVHKGMDKFSLRGKIKVNIQWLLYCMVHNIEKIANYGFT